MRKLLLMTLILMVSASVASAQLGRIGIFSDNGGTNCAVSDTVPINTQIGVYVVHINTPGAKACQYKATQPSCFPHIYLSDTYNFAVNIGTTQVGISHGYGSCMAGNIWVARMNFLVVAPGTGGPCCVYPVEPDPNVTNCTGICIIDCNDLEVSDQVGQSGILNASGPGGGCECSDIIATRDTTWGGVKALYNSQQQ
jgi:hypothetical protein